MEDALATVYDSEAPWVRMASEAVDFDATQREEAEDLVGKEIMIEGTTAGYVRSRTKGSTYVIEIEGAHQTMELGPKSGQKNFTIVGGAPPPTDAGRKRKATDVLNVNTRAGPSYASAPAGSTATKGRPTKKGKSRGGKAGGDTQPGGQSSGEGHTLGGGAVSAQNELLQQAALERQGRPQTGTASVAPRKSHSGKRVMTIADLPPSNDDE